MPHIAQAKFTTATQTKNQLNTLTNKMGVIQQNLNSALSTQHELSQALAVTEKKLGEQVLSLHTIKNNIQIKQQNILNIEHEIAHLQNTLNKQQKTLSIHLQARYQMGANQPIVWLLNQKKPAELNHLLTFYEYIINVDKTLIKNIQQTTQALLNNQTVLNNELTSLQKLQTDIINQQRTLAQMKIHHQALINTIAKTIKTKEQALNDCHQDQERLQTLLKNITQPLPKRVINKINKIATIQLTPNLSHPLQGKSSHTERLNQGIVFFAKEGLPVNAVLPGKVIFSDWLKGYGLLIIIDHGNGMMSLYAHNESLFKTEGHSVKKGEQIATVGHTGGLRENGLYFEIRRRGKAIPPRQWLS